MFFGGGVFCALLFASEQLRPTAVHKKQKNKPKNPTTPLFPAKKIDVVTA